MTEWRLLGLEVEDPDDDLVQPLEAVAVVKGLNAAGDITYWTMKTPDVQSVEALGMFTWGADVALNHPGEEDY